MELLHRMTATQKIVDKFQGVSFVWGKADCIRLASAALRGFGHKVSLIKAGSYSTEKGALRALKRAGFDNLTDPFDARFMRIAPAFALSGDLVGLKSDGEWPSLAVSLGHGRVLGFVDGVCHVLQPLEYVCAWSVPCLKL